MEIPYIIGNKPNSAQMNEAMDIFNNLNEQGLVNLDIKMNNVIVDKESRICPIDLNQVISFIPGFDENAAHEMLQQSKIFKRSGQRSKQMNKLINF